MAKSQQTFNKLEKEKKRKKKKEDKRKKMLARKEARENGELVTNEFVYVDYNGNFTETPPDPADKEKISAESIIIGIPKSDNVKIMHAVTRYLLSVRAHRLEIRPWFLSITSQHRLTMSFIISAADCTPFTAPAACPISIGRASMKSSGVVIPCTSPPFLTVS